MSLVVSDEIVKASGFSKDELLLEIVVLLFKLDKISLGKAAELLKMPQIRFQRLIAERGICVHYDVAELSGGHPAFNREGMALIVVSDNSPLSSLAIVGYLSLLQQLYEYMLKQCLDLFDREAAAKKAVRDAQTALEEAVFAQYSKLTEVENQNVGGG